MDKYKEEEKNLLEALEYKKTHPHASFRWLKGQFKVKKDKINRRWLESQNPHQAHNQLLGPDQDKALVQYCFRLSDIGVPLQHKFIRNAANQILQLAHGDKDGSPPTAGQNWPHKWLKRHPELKKAKQEPLEQNRKKVMDQSVINHFFEEFHRITTERDIPSSHTWNMDETGLRIGVGRGQWVIVPNTKEYTGRFTQHLASSMDTEHMSVVESISGDGRAIAPLLVAKGVLIQERWFKGIECGDIAIAVSDTAYVNDILSFLWLQHWERLTRPNSRQYRLLVLDGYDSHLTYEFVKFCIDSKVEVLKLPPHSTHFLQPLDVVVFQQWKHWHAQELDYAIRHGVGDFNKLAFFSALESIRSKALTPRNINSAWRRCGMIPYKPYQVLKALPKASPELELEPRPTSSGASSDSLPSQWTTPTTLKAVKKQGQAIQDMLRSSQSPPDTPTRKKQRTNTRQYIRSITIAHILHKQLLDYMFMSHIAQMQQKDRRNSSQRGIQKGGLVYAADVEDRHVSQPGVWDILDLSDDQKVYVMIFSQYVLPQLLLRTQKRRKEADKLAQAVVARCTRRTTSAAKKRKRDAALEGET